MNFHECSNALSAHVDQYRTGHPAALMRALARYSDIGVLCALLDAVLSERRWLADIAQYSYAHPNGFAKIVLLHSDQFQLRLHIWRPGTTSVTENIHNHNWDFSSILLAGGYRYQEYTTQSQGTLFYAYGYRGYRSWRGAPSYSLTPIGRQTLGCSFDAYLQAGSSYTLRADTLHRVISDPDRTTASLVLQGPEIRDDVNVLAERPLKAGPGLLLPKFSPATLANNISDLQWQLRGR
jgi:hypothetical protein